MTAKTILGVFAHPDDESMGPGGTFAKYASEGHRVAFVTATDGGAGRLYEERPADNTELKQLRRKETVEAAAIIGAEFLGFLGWGDGDLENMNVLDIEKEIVKIIRREKPDVLVTFHASGISYHPDHRVIAMALSAAFLGCGRSDWYRDEELAALAPHQPSRLYHFAALRSLFEQLDWGRDIYASPNDEVTTMVDTRAWADTRWKAIEAHKTQGHGPPFRLVYEAGGFDKEGFVRVFPSWPAGAAQENDLLAGL